MQSVWKQLESFVYEARALSLSLAVHTYCAHFYSTIPWRQCVRIHCTTTSVGDSFIPKCQNIIHLYKKEPKILQYVFFPDTPTTSQSVMPMSASITDCVFSSHLKMCIYITFVKRCRRRLTTNYYHQSVFFFSSLPFKSSSSSSSSCEWFCVADCCLFDYFLFHIHSCIIYISFCRSRVSNKFTNTLNLYDTNK